jgi:hypothetical protein
LYGGLVVASRVGQIGQTSGAAKRCSLSFVERQFRVFANGPQAR